MIGLFYRIAFEVAGTSSRASRKTGYSPNV